jgi:hypothetical protein
VEAGTSPPAAKRSTSAAIAAVAAAPQFEAAPLTVWAARRRRAGVVLRGGLLHVAEPGGALVDEDAEHLVEELAVAARVIERGDLVEHELGRRRDRREERGLGDRGQGRARGVDARGARGDRALRGDERGAIGGGGGVAAGEERVQGGVELGGVDGLRDVGVEAGRDEALAIAGGASAR